MDARVNHCYSGYTHSAVFNRLIREENCKICNRLAEITNITGIKSPKLEYETVIEKIEFVFMEELTG